MSNADNQDPNEDVSNWEFPGFLSPTTTPVPDEFFDLVAPRLKEGELRVALYIIRRTFGFKKDTDNISLRQMVDGITTRDGRVLDQGTGLSKPAVIKAVRSLVQKRIVIATARRSAERGFEATTYSLNVVQVTPKTVASRPLLTTFTRGGKPSLPGLVNQVDPQQTVVQQTEVQETALISNSFEDKAILVNSADFRISNRNQNENLESLPVEPVERTASSPGFTPVGDALRQRYQSKPTTEVRPQGRGDAPVHQEQPPRTVSKRGRPPKAPDQLKYLIEKFTREFHDDEHLGSNVGQAARLWKASGLDEGGFCQAVYEAASETKTRDIHKRADGQAGSFGMRNKMPYFFAVLRDRLEMKEESETTPAPHQPDPQQPSPPPLPSKAVDYLGGEYGRFLKH